MDASDVNYLGRVLQRAEMKDKVMLAVLTLNTRSLSSGMLWQSQFTARIFTL